MLKTSPLGRYANKRVNINPRHSISLQEARSLTDRSLSIRQSKPQAFDNFLTGPGLGLIPAYQRRITSANPLLQKAIVAMRITEDPQAAKAAFDLINTHDAINGLDLGKELTDRLMEEAARQTYPQDKDATRFLRSILCNLLPHDKRNLDFSVRYSPGIAGPAIISGIYPEDIGALMRFLNNETQHADIPRPLKIFGNSDGTANLGLGWMPPASQWSIMGGKKDLMWLFGKAPMDIHVFDPETIPSLDDFLGALQPHLGYGMFFMEDYTANADGLEPDRCFRFERAVAEFLKVATTHDDQRAFATGAEIFRRNSSRAFGTEGKAQKSVIQGAGAAGIAARAMFQASDRHSGNQESAVKLLDTKGLIHKGRKGLDPQSEKAKWASSSEESLEEVFRGASLYIGASGANAFVELPNHERLIEVMADEFAFMASANPTPEAEPEYIEKLARKYGKRAIIATGRAHDQNVTNNAVVFPNLGRATLDTGATQLDISVFIAMAQASADLMLENGGLERMKESGTVLPSYYHPRLFPEATFAAAKAIVESGHGVFPADPEAYKASLEQIAGEFINPNKQRAAEDMGKGELYLDAFDQPL